MNLESVDSAMSVSWAMRYRLTVLLAISVLMRSLIFVVFADMEPLSKILINCQASFRLPSTPFNCGQPGLDLSGDRSPMIGDLVPLVSLVARAFAGNLEREAVGLFIVFRAAPH